jgi:hypothetical protein
MNGEDNGAGQDQGPVIDQRGALIEARMNMERASGIGVSLGGLDTRDMAQVVEYAKGMALSGPMVPGFCRNQVWTCFGLCIQAMEWKMSPFSVARMAYEVENRRTKEKTIAYMSQLTHAVLESRAPLKARLAVRYEGEGDDTVCVVSGTFRGETEPREWRSPKLGDRRPKVQKRRDRQGNEYETTPGSPLWADKPLVQLFYDTSRDWARIYCPDVTLGIYGNDEMADAGFEPTSGGAPPDDGGLSARLTSSALARAGFPSEQAVAAVDAAMEARDNAPVLPENLSLSVEHADGASQPPAEASSATEAPHDQPAATVEPGQATAADPATSAPEPPDGRLRRRRGPPPELRQ